HSTRPPPPYSYTLPLHDALPIFEEILGTRAEETAAVPLEFVDGRWYVAPTYLQRLKTEIPSRLLKARAVDFKPSVVVRNVRWLRDRKSTRLNSSHVSISYAVVCL